MWKKCPDLARQLEVIVKPMGDLRAPGVAKMWSADFTPNHPLAPTFKESGFTAWSFAGTNQTLVEIAWTGYVKNKAELDLYYRQIKEKMGKAGLLAVDQSSKTERYFAAYYGGTALDTRYGRLNQPAYIKHFEADPKDKVVLSPYQQVGTRELPAFLDPELAPYDWVIDADGHLAVVPETMHPYGRTYEKGFTRPEDKSVKKPGTEEHFGHVAALAGLPGRISGELLYDKKTNAWAVNNKSGRYSMHNPDRTPDQLVNAAALIKETADIQGAFWGPVRYILEYGAKPMAAELERSPLLQYEDPAKKKRAFVELVPSTIPAAPKAAKEKDPAKEKDKDKPKDKDKEKKS
jgi:alkylated DNA nucleotide flippase Atl1